MFDWIASPEAWVALVTLTLLELVLGIDNIVFISILADKLPEEQRDKARRTGLVLAMFMRIGLLFGISLIMGLTATLFTVFGHDVTGKDIVLIVGGLFLLGKATHEIHQKLEGRDQGERETNAATFRSVIVQILLLDIVFSVDSVITAVGMAKHLGVMITAVVISVGFMLLFAGPIGRFVSKHPTVKMLALAFLIMIGTALVADGIGHHIPKGYIYFAMGFSILVEALNLRSRAAEAGPIVLREAYDGND